MQIENLLKQRELLDAQISDVKTSECRKSIAELETDQAFLIQKLANAKTKKKVTDEELTKQISELKSEIERLKNLSFADIYFVSQVEAELRTNREKLADKRRELKSLLSEV